MKRACTLAALLIVLHNNAFPRTIIHAGTLIDGITDMPRREVSIVVEGQHLSTIVDGYIETAERDTLLDLRSCTVMPGLMDMHVHLIGQMSRTSYSEQFFMTSADMALRASAFARRTLMAGFTTVRDLGDDGVVVIALRDAIDAGWVDGPRIFAAGKAIGTTGGHADPTNGLKPDLQGDPGPKEGVINGPEEARKAVRHRYKEGADLIKLTATGGVLSLAQSGQNPQFTNDELKAIVETARDYGYTVAVHAHGTEGMIRAINAGVTSIEHGSFMNEEAMRLMKRHGTVYVPTLMAGDWVARKAQEEGFFPAIVRPKAAEIGPVIRETFRKAYDMGVKIAFGTDSGVSAHGENAREFELMVELGMPPMVAIRAATIEAARLLRIDDRLGTIEPGKLADVVAVPGNPIDDIELMNDVRFVMKGGVVHKYASP